MATLNGKVFILEAFRDLKEDKKAFTTNLAHRVLEMGDDVLRQA